MSHTASAVRSSRLAALLISAGAASSVAIAQGQPDAAMLRFPDVSATHVCFVYANNIWLAPREGGTAVPVASPPGQSTFPKFSPDGKSIAFVGNYDGTREIYTVPLAGGVPSRVTHHPAGKSICDWTPDGSGILFLSNGWAGLARQTQLLTVPATGGLPEKLPMPYAGFGAISPDRQWVAFSPHSTDTRTWKRYRGGMATDLWLLNLKDGASRQITDWEGTDSLPMWSPKGDAVYYVSDAGPEHRLNIWSYAVSGGKRTQLTTFADDDVKWPSAGPGAKGEGEIVFQLGSQLMLLNLGTGKSTPVRATIPGAKPKVAVQAEDAAKTVRNAAISPSGKRVAIEARGDIWSAPAKEGPVRNLTSSNGVFERDPSWSPDGKWLAYFSDESGEYELWVRASDAKEPVADDKDDEKKDEKKGDEKASEEKKADAAPAADGEKDEAKDAAEKKEPKPKFKPAKLTTMGPGFRYSPTWSPDSKRIAFVDKAGMVQVATLKIDGEALSAELKDVDKDPWGGQPSLSWSSDSNWIAYDRAEGDLADSGIWLYNVKEGKSTRVVSAMFACGSPTFDRKGDYLYFRSLRSVTSPVYAANDTTFAYNDTDTILMVPLRADMKSPFAPKSDEEELKKDDKAKDKKDEKKDDKKPEEKKDGANGDAAKDKKDEPKPAEPAKPADDGVSGAWSGTATGGNIPGGGIPFTLALKVAADGKVSGRIESAMGAADISGTYEKASGDLAFAAQIGAAAVSFSGKLKDLEGSGKWSAGEDSGEWTAKRTAAPGADDKTETDKKDADKSKPKEVKIDLEGFERRAVPLPAVPGAFGRMVVSDDHKLIFARTSTRGSGPESGIKIIDPFADEKEEKTVVAAATQFDIAAGGKKLIVFRGGAVSIVDASAGGKSQAVSTANMRVMIDPRTEWRQMIHDVYRLHRDFFYEPTMHGVDWAKARDHYLKMIDDCANREDVAYVMAEMVSELNIGHAYISNPGDVEVAPTTAIGMLGVDWELATTPEGKGFRITRIHEGGPWDSDARGPLSQPSKKKDRVNVGDFLLAVNGSPVDVTKDPYASFIGLVDRATTLTVNAKPVMDGSEREVLVKPASGEVGLRYRSWIESNRKHVEEKSGGTIGYIYVPNTGVDGQSDLFRQFFGQRDKAALIIDERWNGGGQIPTRFIELLNRPVTNYWARRDGHDWVWPPDSHQGPKAMLINGLAGSGGDMFPWLFKQSKVGKVIGTRTWGGLVGISGNPGLIDGGVITVPTFGFYETDGTWGVEGHGVDPDIVVIDDPGKMTKGQDPQLDAAVQHLLAEIKTSGYTPAKRPPSPDRKGMGLPEKDR
ncbi:MAG: S41 family peptidase [Phycisphaerales bacterium]